MREQISNKEGICLLTIYIMGSSLLLGTGGPAGQSAWLAVLVGLMMAILAVFIYIKLLKLYPGQNLFEICKGSLGKLLGTMVIALYTWYAFHLGALVIRNFGEFINTVPMPETPMLVPMLCIGLLCVYAVHSGIEVMARMSAYLLPGLIIIISIVSLLSIPSAQVKYLRPILGEGLLPVLEGGFHSFSFPFAESVLFLGILSALKKESSVSKVYLSGLFLAACLIFITTLRNILVLGIIRDSLYFPSHVAVSRISIGTFLERIEITVSLVFVVGVLIKASVCLLIASMGLAEIFQLKDYRPVVLQIGLLMIYLGYFIYDHIMMMKYWATMVYAYYAFPFQVILPIVLLATALLKKKLAPSGR